jgi:hypothetical protein
MAALWIDGYLFALIQVGLACCALTFISRLHAVGPVVRRRMLFRSDERLNVFGNYAKKKKFNYMMTELVIDDRIDREKFDQASVGFITTIKTNANNG